MNKLLSFILIIAIFFSVLGVNNMQVCLATKQNDMSDISEHWARNTILEWTAKGIIKGYADNTFRPDNNMSKAEFITLINKMYGYYNKSNINYADIKGDEWYARAVSIAKASGYMKWYTNDKLDASKEITRQEICAVLAVIMCLEEPKDLMDDKIMKSYVNQMVDKGYMKGYTDGTFNPQDNITRAEMLIMLGRVIGEFINSDNNRALENEVRVVDGNITVNTNTAKIKNITVNGDLILSAGIDGDIFLENVTVKGRIIVYGRGKSALKLKGSKIKKIIALKHQGNIDIESEDSEIEELILKSDGILSGDFQDIQIQGSKNEVKLNGRFNKILVQKTANIRIANDTRINTLVIDKKAIGSQIDIKKGTTINKMEFNAKTSVTGSGKINRIIINAKGVYIEQKKNKTNADDDEPVPDTRNPIIANSVISVSNVTQSGFKINWNKATDNKSNQSDLEYITYYSLSNNIETYQEAETNGIAVGNYEKDITTKQITGLTGDTTYYFNVVVKDEAGNKSVYQVNSQKTLALPDTQSPTVTNDNLTVENVAETTIDVSWVKAIDNKSNQSDLEYITYYSLSNNIGTYQEAETNGIAVGNYEKDITTKQITGLTGDTTYYFNVVVKDEVGNKNVYQVNSQKTLALPDTQPPSVTNDNLTVDNVAETTIDVSWVKAIDNKSNQSDLEYITYYSLSNNIETYQEAETNGIAVGNYEKDITTKQITGLTGDTTYYFNVVVKDEAGNKASYIMNSKKTVKPVYMYFAEMTSNKIYRANPDGTDVSEYLKESHGVKEPRAIAVGCGYLYWVNDGETKIYYKDLDVSGGIGSFDVGTSPYAIAIDKDNNKIYWSDTDSKMKRSNLDGSNIEDFVTTNGQAESIAVGCGYVYWGNENYDIKRIKIDKSENRTIVKEVFATAIVVDTKNNKIYWADYDNKKITSSDLLGDSKEDIRTDKVKSVYYGVSIYEGNIYYSDEDNRSIEKIGITDSSKDSKVISETNKEYYGIAHD
ncbi:S-layer homology domain-containing protein [Clostridiaceae bacterium M8S5]|nr:S-layer homology domain-containing protein [Clostridiaceae bacterium M8S5]